MWIGFYAFAGPQALRPHVERWGLCLIVPGTLVLARGLTCMDLDAEDAMGDDRRSQPPWQALLASFYSNYFGEFARTGGRSHLTYVTAATEPKQQALEHILAQSAGPGARGRSSRTNGGCMAPHLSRHRASARLGEREPDVAAGQAYQEALHRRTLFFVEFAETPELDATIAVDSRARLAA